MSKAKAKFLDGYKPNFETLLRAAGNEHLALVECTHIETGELIPTLCAVYMEGKEYHFVPLARMLEGNPYEYIMPPSTD